MLSEDDLDPNDPAKWWVLLSMIVIWLMAVVLAIFMGRNG